MFNGVEFDGFPDRASFSNLSGQSVLPITRMPQRAPRARASGAFPETTSDSIPDMRRLFLMLVLLSQPLCGCASLSTWGRAGGDATCDTGACEECEDCGWCDRLFCVGRHPKYSTILDTLITRKEARHLARAELRCLDDNECLNCDYKLGFEQAYVDVAQGASGAVPALPPANYWRSWNRTAEGHARAQNWFAGYAAGSARAVPLYEPFNVVASSSVPGYDWMDAGMMPAGAPVSGDDMWQHSPLH